MVAWNDKAPSRFPSLTISLLIRSQTPTRFSATPPRQSGLSQGWRFSDAERQSSLGLCDRAGFRQPQIRLDRNSAVEGKSVTERVDIGVLRTIKKHKGSKTRQQKKEN